MIEAALAGLFGLLIGSFLNVCIHRMPRDLSVVRPRSFCPACETPIVWYDNLPVLSYALLGGRCRHCRAPIPWRYPAVELLTAAAFVFVVLKLGPTLIAVKFCVFAAIVIALVFTDLEERILPDEFTLGGTLAGVGFAWWVRMPPGFMELFLPRDMDPRWVSVIESGTAAAFLSFVLWGIGALYQRVRGREGLGLGDVKMVACIGAFLGIGPALMTVALGSILGSVTGLLYIWLARKDTSTYELPFGSFLGIAALFMAAAPGPF